MAEKKVNTKKSTKPQSKMVVAELDNEIEELELHDMTFDQIERTVSAFSPEGMEMRRARKQVRYQLYRLRSEAEGKSQSQSTEDFKKSFESQPLFDGWRMFGTTWDVSMDDPYRIIHKDISEQDEWNEVIKAKFPAIDANGKLTYPDIKVRKKVENEVESRKK